jgi:hypothetical protein
MILGLSGFGEAFETFNIVNNFSRLELTKMKADEVSIKEETNIAIDNELKEEWHYTQVLLALFQNNLEAGNVGLNGMPIKYIKVKRRKEEELLWDEIGRIVFDKNTSDYYFVDKFVEALQDYEYAVQPVGDNNVAGNNIYNEIEADFNGAWLIGKDKQFQFLHGLEIGDYETVIPSSIIETLGSQYPYVLESGAIKYRKGSFNCILLSDATARATQINRKQEKLIRNNIMNFLTDGKPKMYKDSSGMIMIVKLSENPKVIPINELKQRVYKIDVGFVEIAGIDSQSLVDNGLIEL